MTCDTSTMGPVDGSEAPPGYTAVRYVECGKCDLNLNCLSPVGGKCTPEARRDGQNVMFVATAKKYIPSAGMCAECAHNVPSKCQTLPFETMEPIRTLPAHSIVVVRCTNFER